MLLTAALDDFKQVRLGQADRASQNRRGDLRLFMKREVANRPDRRPVDDGERVAELDHGRRVHPADQLGEDAVDSRDLRVAEAADIGQEQVGHLAEYAGVVLGSILLGAVQFLAQVRRSDRHGYATSAPVVPARHMAPFPQIRVMPSRPRSPALPLSPTRHREAAGFEQRPLIVSRLP